MVQDELSQEKRETTEASQSEEGPKEIRKKKNAWARITVVVAIVLVLGLLVYLAPPPGEYVLTRTGEERFELQGPGMTFRNVAVEDGRLVIRLGNLGEEPGSPFASGMWVAQIEAGRNILLKSNLVLQGETYGPGDLLTVDKEQNLLRQAWYQRLWHAFGSVAWRVKHPFKH